MGRAVAQSPPRTAAETGSFRPGARRPFPDLCDAALFAPTRRLRADPRPTGRYKASRPPGAPARREEGATYEMRPRWSHTGKITRGRRADVLCGRYPPARPQLRLWPRACLHLRRAPPAVFLGRTTLARPGMDAVVSTALRDHVQNGANAAFAFRLCMTTALLWSTSTIPTLQTPPPQSAPSLCVQGTVGELS